jgi:hypothetical protein
VARIYCIQDGCENYIEVTQPVLKTTIYTCRDHAPKAPDIERFQEFQFDADMPRGSSYVDIQDPISGVKISSPSLDSYDGNSE